MRWLPLLFLCVSACAIGAEEATPHRVFFVPELVKSLEPLRKEQASEFKTITLRSTTGASVFISSVDYFHEEKVQRITDAQHRRAIDAALSQAMKGSPPKELYPEGDLLFYDGTQIRLNFSVRGLNGTPVEMEDQEPWRKDFVRQFQELLSTPRLENLSRLGSSRLMFGITIDRFAVKDEAEETQVADLLKPLLSGQSASDLFEWSNAEKLFYRDPRGTKHELRIFFYESKQESVGNLSASDQQQMQLRLKRHLLEMLVRRPQHIAKLPAPRWDSSLAPQPISEKEITTDTENTLQNYLDEKRLQPWKDLLAFLEKNAPLVQRKILSEVRGLKIRMEPIDSFTHPEIKLSSRQRTLITEIASNSNGTIAIAAHSFQTFNTTDQSYVILYAVLKGINGVSDRGAFDFVTKLRMIVHYEQQKTVEETEMLNMVFAMLESEELAESDRWLKEIGVLKSRYETAIRSSSSESARAFKESLDTSERQLRQVKEKKQRLVLEAVFGTLQSTK